MSDQKKRWPRAAALSVAEELVAALRLHCHRIEVAGSLRRGIRLVGDVEIVYTPLFSVGPVAGDMFATEPVNKAEQRINQLLATRVLEPRLSKAGKQAMGPQNKLTVHVASGIPVDLFQTDEERFWVTLVIRTGPKEFNIRLIEAAAHIDLKLHAYGVFESDMTGEKIVPKSERDVFEIAGLKWEEPEDRQ